MKGLSYIRGAIANSGIREHGMNPYIQVNLGPITDLGLSAQQIVEDSLAAMTTTATIEGHSTATARGATVYRTDFSGVDPDPDGATSGTQVATVVSGKDGARWLAVAITLTRNVGNPADIAKRDALAKGFHAGFS